MLGDGGAEPVVVVDELADELVQPLLENLFHAAVLEPGAGRAGLPSFYAATNRSEALAEYATAYLIAQPPMRQVVYWNVWPNFCATRFRTRSP